MDASRKSQRWKLGDSAGYWKPQGAGGFGSGLDDVQVNCIFQQPFCTQQTQQKEMLTGCGFGG